MEVVGTVAAIVVGVAFLVAGTLKLADVDAWRLRAADLGVDQRIAVAVPRVELAVGALVATQVAEPWPELVAAALLGAFTIVIARRLRDGSRPPCGCFGLRSTRPLGSGHVVRNVALIVVALFAATT